MKRIIRQLSFAALALLSTVCVASDLKNFAAVEPRSKVPSVTVGATAHAVNLPLGSLAGAIFIGDQGELIDYGDSKGLYLTVVTPDRWDNPDIAMTKIPAYIFEKRFDEIEDSTMRQGLQGISRMILEPASEKKIGKMVLGGTTAYIAFSKAKTNIMLTSPDQPDLFTQIVLDNFTWDEVVDEVLKGIRR